MYATNKLTSKATFNSGKRKKNGTILNSCKENYLKQVYFIHKEKEFCILLNKVLTYKL